MGILSAAFLYLFLEFFFQRVSFNPRLRAGSLDIIIKGCLCVADIPSEPDKLRPFAFLAQAMQLIDVTKVCCLFAQDPSRYQILYRLMRVLVYLHARIVHGLFIKIDKNIQKYINDDK